MSALQLVFAADPELMEIVGLSLRVSLTSTLIAGVLGVPLGFVIGFNSFRGKRVVITLLNTLLALGVVPVVNENDTVVTDEIRFDLHRTSRVGPDTCFRAHDK